MEPKKIGVGSLKRIKIKTGRPAHTGRMHSKWNAAQGDSSVNQSENVNLNFNAYIED